MVAVGSLQAGRSPNAIPTEAVLQLNNRTFDDQVRDQVLSSIERIVNGEAATSGAPQPPEITMLRQVQPSGRTTASEDFSEITSAWNVPLVYWAVGGIDPQMYVEADGIAAVPTHRRVAMRASTTMLVASILNLTFAGAVVAQDMQGAEISLPEICRTAGAQPAPAQSMDDMSGMSSMDEAQKAFMTGMMRMRPAMMAGIMAKDTDVAFIPASSGRDRNGQRGTPIWR